MTTLPPPPTPSPHAPSQTRTLTIRHPPHTYLHLTLFPSSSSHPNTTDTTPDILTLRTHLTTALQQFLGLSGTAIPIDILKIEGSECWIRVPREDAGMVVGALGGGVGGWRVVGRGEWLGVVAGGGGEGLFGV